MSAKADKLILKIFKDFHVPVEMLYYEGGKSDYITFNKIFEEARGRACYGSGKLLAFVEYYDFHIYSKNNYYEIIDEVKQKLTENGFRYSLSKSQGDLYEPDTGHNHTVLCFSINPASIKDDEDGEYD